jgi:hypothetical protein
MLHAILLQKNNNHWSVVKMKKSIFLLAFLFFAVIVDAQDNKPFSISIGYEGGVPSDTYSMHSDYGSGGMASIEVNNGMDNFQIVLTTGYMSFSGNAPVDFVIGGVNARTSIISVLLGGKYFLTRKSTKVYGQLNLGYYHFEFDPLVSMSYNEGRVTDSNIGISPVLGLQVKTNEHLWIDGHVNYTDVIILHSYSNWFGIGVGLVYDL